MRDDCPSYFSLPMAQQSCWTHLLCVSRDETKKASCSEEMHTLHADTLAVQTRIRNQRTHLIEALLHENAPLTNNHAERMIRPLVVTRKISGGSQSDAGSATHAVNMTVMQTLSLRGLNFFEGVRAIVHAGNPRYAAGNG